MSVAKTIEITAESAESFGDAMRKGIHKASDSLHQIRSAWLKDQTVLVEEGEVSGYRVRMLVTFEIE